MSTDTVIMYAVCAVVAAYAIGLYHGDKKKQAPCISMWVISGLVAFWLFANNPKDLSTAQKLIASQIEGLTK